VCCCFPRQLRPASAPSEAKEAAAAAAAGGEAGAATEAEAEQATEAGAEAGAGAEADAGTCAEAGAATAGVEGAAEADEAPETTQPPPPPAEPHPESEPQQDVWSGGRASDATPAASAVLGRFVARPVLFAALYSRAACKQARQCAGASGSRSRIFLMNNAPVCRAHVTRSLSK